MWPVSVVVGHVPGQDVFQVASTKDEHAVGTLAADSADETLGEVIGPWHPNGRLDDPYILGPAYLIEAGGKLASRSRIRNLMG
jgi:hypothetical protein